MENETGLQTALSLLLKGKTVLIIAHRMRTVMGADKVVVLADGRVAEEGTPKALMNKKGMYYNMVALQVQFNIPISFLWWYCFSESAPYASRQIERASASRFISFWVWQSVIIASDMPDINSGISETLLQFQNYVSGILIPFLLMGSKRHASSF